MPELERHYAPREVTLILYKAAELQEPTWWLRSVRLLLRPRPGQASYSLPAVVRLGAEMGIAAPHVEAAVHRVTGGLPWKAT